MLNASALLHFSAQLLQSRLYCLSGASWPGRPGPLRPRSWSHRANLLPLPECCSITPTARGKHLFSPPALGRHQVTTNYSHGSCQSSCEVPDPIHASNYLVQLTDNLVEAQAQRSREEGLLRFGSMDLDKIAARELRGSKFAAASTQCGADKQTTCMMKQSLHLIHHFPSQAP